jgi:hypothetical protein
MAEGRSDGGRAMVGTADRYAAGLGDLVVRYADESIIGFQYQTGADGFLESLRERLAKFGTAPGQDAPDRIRQIRRGEPETKRRRETRDVRLSRLHAYQREE